tara:strand:+ start:74 stop:370 length:297 start_codon:yes stop_codon:yes gene_type:complete
MNTFLNKTKNKKYTLHQPHLNNGSLPIQISNKILKNRTNKITENINNNKYNLSPIHLNMFDNANWNHDNKTEMTFLITKWNLFLYNLSRESNYTILYY